MREYEVNVTQKITGKIELDSLVNILQEERSILLGGTDYENRWISNGKVMREGMHSQYPDEEVRTATDEEVKVYEAMEVVGNYIIELKDREIQRRV